jgi:GH18 family chitinase
MYLSSSAATPVTSDIAMRMCWIKLLPNDYSGSLDTTASHDANIYPSTSDPSSTPFNTDQAINYYISQGDIRQDHHVYAISSVKKIHLKVGSKTQISASLQYVCVCV